MNCPNCDHRLNDNELYRFKIDNSKMKLTSICPQCNKMVHFILNLSEEGIKCYSWENSKEQKYAKIISELYNSKYVLFIQPDADEKRLPDIVRQFAVSHGGSSSFIFPEKFSKEASKISALYSTIIIPDNLFPETPSYLAEKLIIENTSGEIFSTNKTIHKRFQIL